MIILCDSRQQEGKHDTKHKWFEDNGIELRRTKLYVGDYTLPTDQSICVDTKKDIQELIGDICGKSHERFKAELIRAQEADIKLVILVENEAGWVNKKQTAWNDLVTCLDDLFKWKNPRLFIFDKGKQKYPRATRGATLAKICYTMQQKYGCEFRFVDAKKSGEEVIKILNKEFL